MPAQLFKWGRLHHGLLPCLICFVHNRGWIKPLVSHLARPHADITAMCPCITKLRDVLERDAGLQRQGVQEALHDVLNVLDSV